MAPWQHYYVLAMGAEVWNLRIMKVLRTKLTKIDLILSWNDAKTSRTTIWTLSEGADEIADVTEFDVIETESEARDLKASVNNLALAIRDATTKNDVEDACIENDASEAVANVEEDDVEDFLEPTTTLYDDFEKRTNAERDSYAFRNWSKRLVREDETILDAELEGRNLKARVNQDLEEQHMKVAAVDDVVEQEVGEGVDDNLEVVGEAADSLAKDENWELGVVGH